MIPCLTALLLCASSLEAGSIRGHVLADFDSGQVELTSYDPAEDRDPNGWELTQDNAYGGVGWSLRLHGNTWKAQAINPYAITRETVLRVAVYVDSIGETEAFGVSDGVNTLFYTVSGTELFTTTPWEVAYQGAFAPREWRLYMLPVGRDWESRYGYEPILTSLAYVNDRDHTSRGAVLFDQIVDVTEDLPVPPQVQIVRGRQSITRLAEQFYRVGIQFHAQVYDPDSDSLGYHWDFGDSTFSSLPDPYHEFLIHADYTYTVGLFVRDETGLWGRDSTQVRVDPGPAGGSVRMNFVGDVMLARGYDVPGGLIDTYGPEYIFVPTRPVYGGAADISVCNLECPLTDRGTPHPTKSYVFRGRPSNVAGLTYAGIDVVSIGNNHIIDYGQEGLDQTLEVLDGSQLRWSGAGDDEYMALQPAFWNEQGIALAFLGQCNRTGREYNYQPFLDAACNKPGFAYLTRTNLDDAIASTRPLVDLLVIQMHAGLEYTTGPGTLASEEPGLPQEPVLDAPGNLEEPPLDAEAPGQNALTVVFPTRPSLSDRQLRWRAVDDGADLVICHHPHVLQGFEVYNGVLIAHSLGNFVFDQSFAETMPGVILTTDFDKEGFRTFTFKPVFIDDMVPKPATGRLGREILDRMADYSRELSTVVGVDPDAGRGTIYLDPASVEWSVSGTTVTVPLTERVGRWVSPPIERRGLGTLSQLVAVEGLGTAEVRVGRELLWHGDFESEGATFWNLNSADEVYDTSIFHQGHRSLRQHRTSQNQGPVTTDLEGFPPTLGGSDFSVCGWVRTENARDAGVSARLFSDRGGHLLDSFEVGPPVSGTSDWTWLSSDFTVSGDPAFFNVRPHMERPESGDAYAWFDEVRLVEWEPWQALHGPLEVPYPNNSRFVQVRFTGAADSATVSWEEVAPRQDPSGIPPGLGPGVPRDALWLAPPRPNPVSGRTAIVYRLASGGAVRLEIFDVSGRRVARLADGPQEAGVHSVNWEAAGLASGLYFCRLEAGSEVRTEKVVVLR